MNHVSIALVHHPVLDRQGNIYTTSITNLDVHDIARSSRTYQAGSFYIVTPITAQQELANAIIGHWTVGKGSKKNKDREAAMAITHVTESIEKAIAQETERLGERPLVWTTSARNEHTPCLSFSDAKEKIKSGQNVMLIFGTGQGLHPSVLEGADALLPPVQSASDYNHLSVRSAAAIIIDRLMASDPES
ncbi:MAG: hypothetical protein CMH56_07290 [Myxococcales bacterium]|nr:hypothetical protein [Myxococcales bacterium]|tara:strand:+ start:859 stop:1428 length:570 start_codon:yes stop_codon:yes gene_type:complete